MIPDYLRQSSFQKEEADPKKAPLHSEVSHKRIHDDDDDEHHVPDDVPGDGHRSREVAVPAPPRGDEADHESAPTPARKATRKGSRDRPSAPVVVVSDEDEDEDEPRCKGSFAAMEARNYQWMRLLQQTKQRRLRYQHHQKPASSAKRKDTKRKSGTHRPFSSRVAPGFGALGLVAATGSVDAALGLLGFLFRTGRVETFALDLFVEIWALCPEAAEERLVLFRDHGCWQQLCLLLATIQMVATSPPNDPLRPGHDDDESHHQNTLAAAMTSSSHYSFYKEHGPAIARAAQKLLQEQWKTDLETLAVLRHSSDESQQSPAPLVSDLAVWLPVGGPGAPPALCGDRAGEEEEDSPSLAAVLQRWIRGVHPPGGPPSSATATSPEYRQNVRELRRRHLEQAKEGRHPKSEPRRPLHASGNEPAAAPPPGAILLGAPPPSTGRGALYPTLLRFGPTGEAMVVPVKGRVDAFLYEQSAIRRACRDFLGRPPKRLGLSCGDRILYVAQGEIGHAVASQCDVIVSDKATTCHVLAVRSSGGGGDDALASLAHIDGPCYDDCLVGLVETHLAHHKPRDRDSSWVSMTFDIVGGFEDDRGSSARLSDWLLRSLAVLAEEYREEAVFTIRTCAVSCLNNMADEKGGNAPVGRGLGLDLRDGTAFLASVDAAVTGPAPQLRSARIWSGGGDGRLAVVHTADRRRAEPSEFVVDPFEFGVFPKLNHYLGMPDAKMILRTSTSPAVEEEDFCASVRKTLRFMREVDCHAVFGPRLNRRLVFRRRIAGRGASNVWERVDERSRG